ncbi:SDR family NAD(P)-dependent oxidoreductase [Algoriphagus halophilus]|uniref:NAD(P)-dependent dehydrogenase, short-chain alcohol dehydrogenase family n=1 Tax=Algoriphagus halophilus TaxID=226505 RepID=A0A1N6DNQ5_9BACT|nr:SDR family oxidoreductase [Algoriphagus halophilus]SIN72438.1 NAD(P)-dependent dehydrogenase, short-chain alcohol dehydrogenase family [Algoriphagus halophilus]
MKNYLIIGASSGIGNTLAKILAESGHQVFGTYFKNEVEEDIPNLSFSSLNVMDEDLNLDFLPEKLDGIAYCPGSINLKPFSRIKPEEFIQDYELQVVGAIKVLQAVSSRLKASENSSVVLFSTVAVQKGFNFHTQVAASKGALEGLTRSLASEWAPSIRVNAIAPSITDTPLAQKLLSSEEKKSANAQRHPLKKIGSTQDIAEMANFLLTEKSSWITGQVFHVDGGMAGIN